MHDDREINLYLPLNYSIIYSCITEQLTVHRMNLSIVTDAYDCAHSIVKIIRRDKKVKRNSSKKKMQPIKIK